MLCIQPSQRSCGRDRGRGNPLLQLQKSAGGLKSPGRLTFFSSAAVPVVSFAVSPLQGQQGGGKEPHACPWRSCISSRTRPQCFSVAQEGPSGGYRPVVGLLRSLLCYLARSCADNRCRDLGGVGKPPRAWLMSREVEYDSGYIRPAARQPL